ncbi:hypothetical protein HUA78_45575 [Myxococcus sp. CA033]|nr:hypothetical protein [Myxococcus sp. CA033]
MDRPLEPPWGTRLPRPRSQHLVAHALQHRAAMLPEVLRAVLLEAVLQFPERLVIK